MNTQYDIIKSTYGVLLDHLGLNDIALRKDDAIIAIEALRNAGVPILGGDVYVEKNGNIEIAYTNWYVDKKNGESRKEFAERSFVTAHKNIEMYPNEIIKNPLFVLILMDE